MSKSTEKVPYFTANQKALEAVEGVLFAMKQPMNNTKESQAKLRTDLKAVLKEILEITQQQLLLANSGKPSSVKADAVGWTTANTDFGNAAYIKDFPHGKLVNVVLKELIKEQEQVAAEEGVIVSETQILAAQADALDNTKDTITLESINQEGKDATRLEIDKETGDTTIYEKNLETGEFEKVGTLKRFWLNVKEFCSNIWGWIKKQCNRFKNWICGIFKAPEDREIVQGN